MKYIKGNYRKSIFKSDKGYVIGLFKVVETNDSSLEDYVNRTITFTGYFNDLNEDETYIFYGDETVHPRYGFQFEVSSYERVKPTGKDGVTEFLASDLFPGIGLKQAGAIANVLGDNALDEILKDPSCLNLVPKLSKKKADKIYEILSKYEESYDVTKKLIEMGFTMKDALIIYNEYRYMTMDVINKNIYKLIEDISELNFKKVDSVARKMGINFDDKRRVKAAILYVMNLLIFNRGDLFLSFDDIMKNVNAHLNLSLNYEDYEVYFKELSDLDKIIIKGDDFYLKEIYEASVNVVNRVHLLANMPCQMNKKLNSLLDNMEKVYQITYNDKQKEAIIKALEKNILIITGGPGTGKTTIIKAITELYQKINNLSYDKFLEELALLAPTGRASKRMSEGSLLPASTIHRFLKWDKDGDTFLVNENNKASSKLVIIDEMSMIDICLFDSLLKGLKDNIKLILVGDYNQLPSVGPGEVLKSLIESEVIDTVHLDQLYRQSEDSYITTLAYEIRNGNLSQNYLETKGDYTFLECSSIYIKKNLKNLCKTICEKGYDYKKVQVLAPMYRGENGIDLLNKQLQEVFNPKSKDKREIKHGDVVFRENDKILQLVNMPDEGVYNGDIGVIKYIKYANTSKTHKNEIYVDFDGTVVKYTSKDFGKIKHGFIISIHKSQGSEFDIVIMPISLSYGRMLYKKLVYTGITRAKRKLILIGEPKAFERSVYNNCEYKRNSKLFEMLLE